MLEHPKNTTPPNGNQPGFVYDGSLQPHNKEAEEQVLGIILLSGVTALTRVQSVLTPADFSDARNSHVYTACVHLQAKGAPVDQVTVTTKLRDLESLEEVGPAYLSHLVANALPPTNLEYYAEQVQEASKKRKLNQIGVRLVEDSHNGVKSWQAAADARRLLELLEEVANGSVRDEKLPQLQITALSEVEAEVVHWLWEKWLPLGKQSVLAGDPGLGKSYLALDIAARVSRGGPLPPWMEGGKE